MPRNEPHTVYKNAEGKRVPGTTTILGILGKPAIIHWAWEQGIAGLDYRESRDAAGDTGTLVHYLALCDLSGSEPDLTEWTPAEIASTKPSMQKFQEWKAQHELEPILMETPLVSELFQFGGTPDYYGLVGGVPTLLDFKTGKRIYDEALYQVAAYRRLLIEAGHDVDEVRIVRLGKTDDEGFEEKVVDNLDKHFELFLHCWSIHRLQKLLRKEGKETRQDKD